MKPTSSRVIVVVFLFVVVHLGARALTTDDRPLPPPVPYHRGSGLLGNPTDEAQTVHTERVAIPGAAWLRVYFGEVVLGPGSFVRITADSDGEVQELDAETLSMWNNTSAYFNGNSVFVELVAGPATVAHRVVIERLAYDSRVALPKNLCGADDRVVSNRDCSGRVLPGGCTGAVWNDDSCLLSAGHCFDSPDDSELIEFRVPQNAADCEWQHPPVADQFPILEFAAYNNGVGKDWAVTRTGTNSLGQTIYERYGEICRLALDTPQTGDSAELWGYGSDSECLLDNVQQRSLGEITDVEPTFIAHDADTEGGSSGTGILHDGKIVAVHTHGGCPRNKGTRIDIGSFATARANLCISEAGSVDLDRPFYSCDDEATITVQDRSLIDEVAQAVTLESDTEPDPETLVLAREYAAVFAGALEIQDVPVASGDGVLSVTHGDTITVTYVDLDDGVGSGAVPRVANAIVDCLGPVIADVRFSEITVSSVVVGWTTDEPSSSRVTAPEPGTVSDPTLVTQHAVLVEDLSPCAVYLFTVSSVDAAGNESIDDNAGDFHSVQTSCPAAPPPVPDGSGSTRPMTAERIDDTTIEVAWDNQCLGTGPTKILYGPLDAVAQYTLSGAACGISPAAESALLHDVPPGNLWFVAVKEDGAGVEGSWGQGASGERNGAEPSDRCGASAKDPETSCP